MNDVCGLCCISTLLVIFIFIFLFFWIILILFAERKKNKLCLQRQMLKKRSQLQIRQDNNKEIYIRCKSFVWKSRTKLSLSASCQSWKRQNASATKERIRKDVVDVSSELVVHCGHKSIGSVCTGQLQVVSHLGSCSLTQQGSYLLVHRNKRMQLCCLSRSRSDIN